MRSSVIKAAGRDCNVNSARRSLMRSSAEAATPLVAV